MASQRHARYWQRFILAGERVIHTFGISGGYIFLFWGVPVLLVVIFGIAVAFLNVALGALMLIPALALLAPVFYLTYFVHYAITDKRVMEREGIFHKRFVTVDLPSITDILIRETFLERFITHTGTILVNTAGSPGSELRFSHVRRPFDVRQDIYRHLQQAQRHPAPQSAATPPDSVS